MIGEDYSVELQKQKDELRKVRENILSIQEKPRNSFNKSRKPEKNYHVNVMVAIKRIQQFGSGLKVKGKFLGPYVVKR